MPKRKRRTVFDREEVIKLKVLISLVNTGIISTIYGFAKSIVIILKGSRQFQGLHIEEIKSIAIDSCEYSEEDAERLVEFIWDMIGPDRMPRKPYEKGLKVNEKQKIEIAVWMFRSYFIKSIEGLVRRIVQILSNKGRLWKLQIDDIKKIVEQCGYSREEAEMLVEMVKEERSSNRKRG